MKAYDVNRVAVALAAVVTRKARPCRLNEIWLAAHDQPGFELTRIQTSHCLSDLVLYGRAVCHTNDEPILLDTTRTWAPLP